VSVQTMHGITNHSVKVLFFSLNPGLESLLPLVYHLVDSDLFEVSLDLHQSLL